MSGYEKRFLITRLPPYNPHFYDFILAWVGRNAPELKSLFDLQTVTFEIPDDHQYGVHIPWLQDPVQAYNMPAYEDSCRLAEQCDARSIPIINRVDKLTNACKVRGSEIIREAGFRTPRMALIENRDEFLVTSLGFQPPFFIRDDWSHSSKFHLVESIDQTKGIPWEQYRRPVVCEFIDTRTAEGHYRRFRCIVAGNQCIASGLLTCDQWKVKARGRISTVESRENDLAYALAPEPNSVRFLEAARKLELQWLAFDYGCDPISGEVIVWEANPYPNIDSAKGDREYRRFIVDRIVAAMIRLYLKTAGLEVPRKIERLAQGD